MNNTSDWKNEVMDDCIHLHACRRVQKIGRTLGISCPRYCSVDCNCYQSKNDNTMLVSVKDAINYARDGVSSIRAGCIKMTEKDNMMSLTAVGNNSRLFVMSKSDSADAFGYSDFLSKKMSEQRFFNNTFSYLDIKEFNIEELPEKIRKPLQKEILSFCKECVAGGKKYGFNYIES